jgi:hypothetical protein
MIWSKHNSIKITALFGLKERKMEETNEWTYTNFNQIHLLISVIFFPPSSFPQTKRTSMYVDFELNSKF